MTTFQEKYDEFVGNKNNEFMIVENPQNQNTQCISKINTLLILDSSFNPPHKGHLQMLLKAIKKYKTKNKLAVLLQLSINNVDKGMKPALPTKRLKMMSLFAKDLHHLDNDIYSYISLTKYGKFTDKITPINTFFGKSSFEINQFIFLLGFDTLERLFMPKYYLPNTVEDSLAGFFKTCKIDCLTRGKDYELQTKWKADNVPLLFQNKIDIEVNEDLETSNISSSNIRDFKNYNNCTKLVEKYICESKDILF
ncbi:hypothetical protein ACO0SA_002601 [Hanseniaspora valbyensis]